MAGRIRLVVPNVASYQCALSRWYEANVGEPVGENSSQVLDSGRVAVDHDRKEAARQVFRIVPTFKLQLLCLLFPPVELGSGFPPSAQTKRSIISFSELGA